MLTVLPMLRVQVFLSTPMYLPVWQRVEEEARADGGGGGHGAGHSGLRLHGHWQLGPGDGAAQPGRKGGSASVALTA